MSVNQWKRSSRFWIVCFVLWFITLNLLSHGNRFHPAGPFIFIFEIPHFDKIVHFGYFFGGSGLLSAALYLAQKPSWIRLSLIVTAILLEHQAVVAFAAIVPFFVAFKHELVVATAVSVVLKKQVVTITLAAVVVLQE